MTVDVLGPVRVRTGGAEVVLTGRHTPAALAYLAMNAAREVPLRELARAIGRDATPRAIRSLRAMLQQVAAQLPEGALVIADTARFHLADSDLDADRFADLVRDAYRSWQAGGHDQGMTTCRAALDLWRGEPYPELQDSLDALPVIHRLRECHLDVVALSQELGLDRRVDFATIAELRYLAASYPARRTFRLQLARALAIAGRHVESLRVLRDTATELGDSPITRTLTTLISQRDPAAASTPTIEVSRGTVS